MKQIERILNNRSKIRRLLLLRKFQYKIRSLKRTRYFQNLSQRTIGKKYALESAIYEIIEFLNCSYQSEQDERVKKEVKRLTKALEVLTERIQLNRPKERGIPIRDLKSCTVAMKDLYYTSRKSHINYDCDEFWFKFGHVLIVLYQL